MRIYADKLQVDSVKAFSAMASDLGLSVGQFPQTIEFGTRTFATAVRVLNKFRDLEAYRYTALDSSTITIWND
jgi:hypothetical protein